MNAARRAALAVVFLASVSGFAALVFPRAHAAPPEPIRIACGTIAPEGTPWSEQIIEIKQRIERESGGRVRLALFFGGRRGSEADMLTELRRGKLQAAALSNGIVTTVVPECAVLEMPFFFRDSAEADHVIDEVVGQDLATKMAEKGIVLSLWAENGWRSIGTRKRAVRAPEDIKGLKVRAQESEINKAFWNALGAAPTPIPLNEVLPALETGVIEGFDQTPVYMCAAGWHAQIKYYTLTEHMYQPACLVFNKRFIESLPEDLQKIVLGDGRAEAVKNRTRVRAAAKELLKDLAAQKIEVIALTEAEKDAFRKRVEPLYKDLRETVGPALFDKVRAALDSYRARRPNG
jgi:tripartite ATP-independent transporter DctP family solute receptor